MTMNSTVETENQPIFASRRLLLNFVLITLCSQFTFALLAMKGVLLPQILELWDVSKTQFGLLLSLYGFASNVMYVLLSWVQDRYAPQQIISVTMIIGGITTFFLGKTSDFNVLLSLLLVLAICCEGAFWPAILSSVRKSTSDGNQSKVFGILEGGRGLIEFLQNAITLGLYAWLGYSVLGLEVAFMINGSVMVLLGITCWFRLPKESLLKSSTSSGTMMKEVVEGMRFTLALPEIWLAGIIGFFIYFAYTSLPFYITYLNESYTLPVIAASIFGVISTSLGRISSAFVAGFATDKLFGGSSGGMQVGLMVVAVLGTLLALLPITQSFAWVAMALLMPLVFTVFFMRALYFAPYGEMGLPPRFSGSVISVAAFVVYAPSSFAYLLWGFILDSYPGAEGYRYLFATLAVVGAIGAAMAVILRRRMSGSLRDRIALQVSELDDKLGLEGEEKTFAKL
jgi:sugar phosphate permease